MPVAKLKSNPVPALELMVDLYLDPEIASPRKVSVWYAFWGEASSRQEYYDICGQKDESFAALVRELIGRLIEETSQPQLDPDGVALGLIGVLEMLWQDFAFRSEENIDRAAAKRRCMAYLRSVFPGQFAQPPGAHDDRVARCRRIRGVGVRQCARRVARARRAVSMCLADRRTRRADPARGRLRDGRSRRGARPGGARCLRCSACAAQQLPGSAARPGDGKPRALRRHVPLPGSWPRVRFRGTLRGRGAGRSDELDLRTADRSDLGRGAAGAASAATAGTGRQQAERARGTATPHDDHGARDRGGRRTGNCSSSNGSRRRRPTRYRGGLGGLHRLDLASARARDELQRALLSTLVEEARRTSPGCSASSRRTSCCNGVPTASRSCRRSPHRPDAAACGSFALPAAPQGPEARAGQYLAARLTPWTRALDARGRGVRAARRDRLRLPGRPRVSRRRLLLVSRLSAATCRRSHSSGRRPIRSVIHYNPSAASPSCGLSGEST